MKQKKKTKLQLNNEVALERIQERTKKIYIPLKNQNLVETKHGFMESNSNLGIIIYKNGDMKKLATWEARKNNNNHLKDPDIHVVLYKGMPIDIHGELFIVTDISISSNNTPDLKLKHWLRAQGYSCKNVRANKKLKNDATKYLRLRSKEEILNLVGIDAS